ncbi:MAG: hypothetical protein V3U53_00775, partial [bacterium]
SGSFAVLLRRSRRMESAIDGSGTVFSPHARRRIWSVLAVLPLFIIFIFFIPYPIGVLLLGSLSKVEPTRITEIFNHLTLDNYIEMYGTASLYKATLNSLIGCAGGGGRWP